MNKFSWEKVYSPTPASFERRLSSTLEHLEALSMKTKERGTRRAMTVLVAAIIGVLVIGGVVYAAAPVIRSIFGGRIQEIEQYGSLPDDEKLQEQLDIIRDQYRGHAVDTRVEFEGVEIALTHFMFSSDSEDDGEHGRLFLSLTYSGMPTFDPNYVDFAVRYGGVDHPQNIERTAAVYRRRFQPATTIEELVSESRRGNTRYSEGVLTMYLFFEVPRWKIDEAMPMELRAVIGGEEFIIPFAFDPEKAYETAVAWAHSYVDTQMEMYAERRSWYEALVGQSAEVGIEKANGEHAITLSEISYARDMLNFSFAIRGRDGEQPDDLFGYGYWMRYVRVDGILVPFDDSTGERTVGEDCEVNIHSFIFSRSPDKLPDESVIYILFESWMEQPYEDIEFIFRYCWKTGEVILPLGDDEEALWLDEERALFDEKWKTTRRILRFDLGDQQREFVSGNIQMTVGAIRMSGEETMIECTFVYLGEEERKISEVWIEPLETTLNGYAAHSSGYSTIAGRTNHGRIIVKLHDNVRELDDVNELTIEMQVRFYDTSNVLFDSADFRMAFTLDKTTAS